MIGVAVGSAIGSGVPVLGNILGGVFGFILGMFADCFSRWVYRICVTKKEAPPPSAKEIANEAAKKFDIADIDKISYELAHDHFREKILAVHTDRNPDASEEEKTRLTQETTDILASWHIVRDYYKQKGKVDDDDEDESTYIKTYVLRVKEDLKESMKEGIWRIKRMFFEEDVSLGMDINEGYERLEIAKIHV